MTNQMAAATIHTLPSKRSPLVLRLDQLVGFEGVVLLSRLLREYHLEQKIEIKEIAAKANLCKATVSKIMSRETKSPRMLTCIMLFKAIGFQAVRFD